jgi:hypothetical protein
MATVDYLRGLGAEHQQIVLEFSRWVLRANPEMGLTIFSGMPNALEPCIPRKRDPYHPQKSPVSPVKE